MNEQGCRLEIVKEMGNRSSASSTELTEDQIKFILANTLFNREQVFEWHKEFLKECPSGKLKRTQFETICSRQSTTFPKEVKQFSKYAFKTFDKDNSGFINFSEFVLAISASSNDDMVSNLRLAFKMYDINGDGTISRSELKKIIKALYTLRGITKFFGEDQPSKRVDMIFEKYDKSRDNKISENEFITACLNDHLINSLLTNI